MTTGEVYSPIIFIGREKELALFEKMLDEPGIPRWILNLHGEGGLGKTQLLHRFADTAAERQNVLVTDELIDLYWTAHQRELGILKSIADQLAPKKFGPFYTALDKYNQLLSQRELTESKLLHDQAVKTRDQFLDIYKSLPAERIVLLFDTAEVAGDVVLRFWQETLPRLKEVRSETLVVVAGREPVEVFPSAEVELLPVAGFSPDEVGTYFKRQGLDLSPDLVARVAELSRGRPVLIALTVDWIRFGNAPQDLVAYQPDRFEPAMVERVQQLRFPEDQAILAMAHLHRRFNEQILAYILERSPEVALELTESLSRFSFVKYRPPVDGKMGSCTLHDEMRALVNRHVWPILDPLGEYRREWNKKIVGYYKQKIEAESDQFERQNLELERLFYWLDSDLKTAFAYSGELFEHAMDTYDADFMEAVNAESGRKKESLTPAMQCECEFRKAIVLHQRERYPEAIQTMTALVDNPECDPDLRASALARLVEFHTDSGDPKKAIDIGLEGEKWCEALLDKIPPEDPRHRSMELTLGTLCNNLGFAHRSQNRMNKAVDYYVKALTYFLAAGGAHSQVAITRNNLGFVYHRLGRDEEALAQCEIALKIRQRLRAYDLGFSYNVLGAIYTDQMRTEEAVSNFEQALRAFAEAGSERGKALTCVAYGRLMRQWGWYKEKYAGESHDRERKEYLQAQDMLDKAIRTFRQFNDRSNLSEALNEMGTLLRQQERWDEALEHFKESAELARQIGNAYREIDNLQDIGILYDFSEEVDKALEYAQQASSKAWQERSYYLYARAQRTVGNVLFAQGKYDQAFKAVANACVYILRLDPGALGHSSAKKGLEYDEFEDWASELILKLPNHELARQKCEYLIEQWKKEELEGKRLAELYPGFIVKMESGIVDYPFLVERGEER
jgi:tetratricopeptide (TPR) repeat protein